MGEGTGRGDEPGGSRDSEAETGGPTATQGVRVAHSVTRWFRRCLGVLPLQAKTCEDRKKWLYLSVPCRETLARADRGFQGPRGGQQHRSDRKRLDMPLFLVFSYAADVGISTGPMKVAKLKFEPANIRKTQITVQK